MSAPKRTTDPQTTMNDEPFPDDFPKTKEAWEDAIRNAKFEPGMLARAFLKKPDSKIGDGLPAPPFMGKKAAKSPAPEPVRDENGETIGEKAVREAAERYDAGGRPRQTLRCLQDAISFRAQRGAGVCS